MAGAKKGAGRLRSSSVGAEVAFGSHGGRGVNHEELDIQEDLTYREHPVRILDEEERKTRDRKSVV